MSLALSVKKNGFTMIELIMVITLIGVLSYFAATRIETNTFDERYYSDDIVSAYRYAQKFALSTGCQVQVTVNNSGFALFSNVNCVAGGASTFSQPILRPWSNTAFVNQAAVPANFQLQDTSNNPINTNINTVFYPQGWACTADGESTTTVTIQLVGTSATRILNIVCSTGFVYVTS